MHMIHEQEMSCDNTVRMSYMASTKLVGRVVLYPNDSRYTLAAAIVVKHTRLACSSLSQPIGLDCGATPHTLLLGGFDQIA